MLLDDDETEVWSSQARRLARPFRFVRGTIFVTSRNLRFEPRKTSKPSELDSFKIPLTEIEGFKVSNGPPFLPLSGIGLLLGNWWLRIKVKNADYLHIGTSHWEMLIEKVEQQQAQY